MCIWTGANRPCGDSGLRAILETHLEADCCL
jgi:hypothetical protein